MKYIKSSKDGFLDLLCRIKNGYLAKKKKISVIKSNLNEMILSKLNKLGFILSFSTGLINEYIVFLRYNEKYEPAIKQLKMFSTENNVDLTFLKKRVPYNGLGVWLLSTSKGILTNFEALEKKVGGFLFLEVF